MSALASGSGRGGRGTAPPAIFSNLRNSLRVSGTAAQVKPGFDSQFMMQICRVEIFKYRMKQEIKRGAQKKDNPGVDFASRERHSTLFF